jgi:leader peptidase (prepilin peptidase)/N-methyltransferase
VTGPVLALPAWFTILLATLLGLIFGSFATALSYRVPRNQSMGGRSRCPHCGRQLGITENVPLLGWILLRGRCKSCGRSISIRYPITEAVTALLFALAAWRFGFSMQTFVYAAFFFVLVVLTVIDLEHKLLPNRIVYPTFVTGWLALAITALLGHDLHRLWDASVGALIFGGSFLVVGLLAPLGGGDIKLAFVLGTFLGFIGAPGVVLIGMFMSFLLGGVTGIGLRLFAGATGKTEVPFGPFLAAGTATAVLFGPQLVDLYVGRL